PGLGEGEMVAAAAEAVAPEDEAHPLAPRDLLQPAGHLAAGGVDAVRSALAEDAGPAVLRAVGGAHDVVGDHAAGLITLLAEPLLEAPGTEQPLLFAGHGGEDEGGAEAPGLGGKGRRRED